jgi:hypothetical protein
MLMLSASGSQPNNAAATPTWLARCTASTAATVKLARICLVLVDDLLQHAAAAAATLASLACWQNTLLDSDLMIVLLLTAAAAAAAAAATCMHGTLANADKHACIMLACCQLGSTTNELTVNSIGAIVLTCLALHPMRRLQRQQQQQKHAAMNMLITICHQQSAAWNSTAAGS